MDRARPKLMSKRASGNRAHCNEEDRLRIIDGVRWTLQETLGWYFECSPGVDAWAVECMGSRVYGLDTETSEVDLYLECPADVSDCADILLHVLARLAGSGLARHGYKDGPALQESKWIAKWTDAKIGIDVSPPLM